MFRLPRRPTCLVRMFAALLAVGALVAPVILRAPQARAAQNRLLNKGDRVAIVGDSITEQKQYSRFIEMYLTVCVPELDLRTIQLGCDDETASGFHRRMNRDLIPFRPDVVTTCYGMNDGRYQAYNEDIGKSYREPMQAIVADLKKAGVTVIVGSPGCVDIDYWPRQYDAYNQTLAHLRDIARDVAAAEGMPFANIHDEMMAVMKKAKAAYGRGYHVCGIDWLHPSANGQLIMAYVFLKAMGLDGNIGTITIDMAGKATATDGHTVLSCSGGNVKLKSVRYPFCLFGDEKSPNSQRSILPFLPFNNDLNRLMLVVTGLKSARAKVTWGKASKTFTRAQLEEGINLSDEFFDNPFSDAFRKVDGLVAQKQNYETWLIRESNLAAVTVLKAELLAKYHAVVKAIRKAFVPVRHKITIETE
jgi:lysophospholipase L1-like esterase